jgi:hypothetical protein
MQVAAVAPMEIPADHLAFLSVYQSAVVLAQYPSQHKSPPPRATSVRSPPLSAAPPLRTTHDHDEARRGEGRRGVERGGRAGSSRRAHHHVD